MTPEIPGTSPCVMSAAVHVPVAVLSCAIDDCGSRKFHLVEDGYAEIRSTLEFDYAMARLHAALPGGRNSPLPRCAREWDQEISGCAPLVPVMKTADLRDSDDPSEFWRLHSPCFRRVLAQ